jgi:uncharacterized protein (TIRG00374 family)
LSPLTATNSAILPLPFKAPPAPPPPKPSRKRWTALVLGATLSIALPILAFQGVNLAESWSLILNCRAPELAAGGLFFLLTLGFRSWRWRFLLAAQQDVSVRSCLSATCVGLMANNVLPFRLGDLVRVGALRQLERANGARVLGTVAVERILDILTLVFFLGAYLALVSAGPHEAELLAAGVLALAGGSFLALVLVVGYLRRAWLQHVLAAPARWVSPGLGDKAAGLVGRFLEGLQVFASPGQVVCTLGLSAALWGAAAGSYYFVGQSLGLNVPAQAYLVVVFTTAFGAIIPAAPGAVGTFHSFAALGLYLVAALSEEQALAFAALLHALEWTLTNAAGLYFLGRDRLHLAAAPEGEPHATPTAAGASPGPAHHPQPV